MGSYHSRYDLILIVDFRRFRVGQIVHFYCFTVPYWVCCVYGKNIMLFIEAKKIIVKNKKQLSKLGARALSLFGSVSKDESSPNSDIDILVDFDAKKGLFAFVFLKNYLEGLLGCEVDLVTKKALHPMLKKRILHEAKHVF